MTGTFFLTGGLVVVTGGQIGFLIRADSTARKAADAALRAATATENTIAKMDETAEKQLRAYLWLKASVGFKSSFLSLGGGCCLFKALTRLRKD